MGERDRNHNQITQLDIYMYQKKGKKRGTISNIAVGGTDRRARVRDQNLEKGQGKGSWDRGRSCFKKGCTPKNVSESLSKY